MWISQSKAAQLPGVEVSKQRINTLVGQGRLETNAKREVRSEDVRRLFAKDTDPAWEEQSEKQEPAASGPVDDAADDGEEANESPSFREARTREKLLSIEQKEFDLNRQRGLYVPRADVERAMESAGRKLRQQLDTLPHMADELYAAARDGSAADLRRLLKEKARRFEQALADAMSGSAAREDDAAGA